MSRAHDMARAAILASHRQAKAQRIKRGVCVNSATHGEATHGQMCQACREKHRVVDARTRARRRMR